MFNSKLNVKKNKNSVKLTVSFGNANTIKLHSLHFTNYLPYRKSQKLIFRSKRVLTSILMQINRLFYEHAKNANIFKMH